jgi:hypothetical protein
MMMATCFGIVSFESWVLGFVCGLLAPLGEAAFGAEVFDLPGILSLAI